MPVGSHSAVLAALLAASPPAHPPGADVRMREAAMSAAAGRAGERFLAIAELRAARAIDDESALVYALMAVRRPDLLPPALRSLPAAPLRCAAPLFIDGLQRARRRTLSAWGAVALREITPRPATALYVDSARLPLRVHYPDASYAAKAAAVLGYAEESWDHQVVQVGFRAPRADPGGESFGGSTALDLYISSADGAAGLTIPALEGYSGTDEYDAFAYIIIEKSYGGTTPPFSGSLKTTVAHEFNHACQLAYDGMEWLAFYENSATYMMDRTYDDVNDFLPALPGFQNSPTLPFEAYDYTSYEYGGMLVAATIDAAFGTGDGTVLREVWEGTPQVIADPGNPYATDNEPDFLDALALVLGRRVHVGLDEFQAELTEWRYLLGGDGDAQHFTGAAAWAQPVEMKGIEIVSLPVTALASSDIHAHGSGYIRFYIGEARTGTLHVSFAGGPGTRWAARVLCPHEASLATVLPVNLDGSGKGEALVEAAGVRYCVLAASDLGPADYDPDRDFEASLKTPHTFSYGADFTSSDAPGPSLAGVTPQELSCPGALGIALTGGDFLTGASVNVGGERATVTAIESTAITAIAPPLAPGSYDVVVTNPGGKSARLARGLTYLPGCRCACDEDERCDAACTCDADCSVVCFCDTSTACDAACACDPECAGEGGCGCSARQGDAETPHATAIAPALGLALLAAARRRASQRERRAR